MRDDREQTQQGAWLWHHVTPACSGGCWVLRFLKGPAWCLWGKTESVIAQLDARDTEWVGCYCTARLLSWLCVCVCVCIARIVTRQWGNGLLFRLGVGIWNAWEGGGKRRVWRRIEQKLCLASAGEAGVSVMKGRERWKKHKVGFELKWEAPSLDISAYLMSTVFPHICMSTN